MLFRAAVSVGMVGTVLEVLRIGDPITSMVKTGVCWDNALAESFFATYKLEQREDDPERPIRAGPPPECGNAGAAFSSAGTCPAGQTCQTVCRITGLSCECH